MNTKPIKGNFGKFSCMAVIGTATASLLIAGVPTSPVHASQEACRSWPSPANATNIKTVRSTELNGRTIELRSGYVNGIQMGWTRMLNSKNDELIWMDVSFDRGKSVAIQCGPFYISDRQYTPAYPTSQDRNRQFRACGNVWTGQTYKNKCTDWW
jgi:hypothetical protein